MRLWLFSAILIVHSLCLTTVAQTISSHCLKECGGVSIPFPFGIGPGCSHNASFAITCRNNSTGLPKPYLDSIGGLEVVEIQLDLKSIVVMQAVSPLKCSLQEQTLMPLGKSLVETPFFITSVLAVVGCKAEVWLVDSSTNASSLGCRCRYTTFGCTGNNCCMIDPTTRGWAQELAIHYKTYEQGNGNDDDICGFSFLADPIWLMRNYSIPLNLSLQYTPMALSWPFTDIPIADNQGISCYKSSHVFLPTLDYSYRTLVNTSICNCKDGYEGNPYLPSGCQDIDECFNSTSNNCAVETTCVNTAGSYACLPVIESNRIKLMIIGISSGVGSLLMLIGTWICLKVIRKRIKASRKKKFFKHNGGLLLQQQLSSNDGGTERIKLFSSKELALATDRYNDNRILGRGGQGTVYKGMLHDGRIVAVKKSKKMEETDIEAFINEVVILSQINHRNVVKLLGCCLETEVPLLVYEFIPNGTLFQHIHDQNDEYFPLSWKMRVRIATEVAGVLSYLHNAASVPIYHRDIKSTNILLDDKYRAKVSDFGTSRSIAIDQTHLTTRVLGTFGYLDPEYFQSSQFTEKSDVYSFGVVMVELLTGEKAISKVRAETGRSLATHFLQSMDENNLSDILDPKILKEGRMDEIVAVAKLARRCLNLSGKRRPTMKEVAAGLVGIQMMEDGSASPYNLEDMEFESIEIWEDYEFPSTSNRTNMNESSKSPLMFSN